MDDGDGREQTQRGWTDLGGPLRVMRRELGLSQRALAERAGVAPSTVGRLETEHVDVRLDLAAKVLRAAGLRFAIRRLDGRPFRPDEDDVDELERVDSWGDRRMPAHLAREPVRGLPLWTYRRRDQALRGRNAPDPLDLDERWVYRRRPAVPAIPAADTVCHADGMDAGPAPSEVEHPEVDHRVYRDLAPWWPLLSPVDDHEAAAAYVATLLCSAEIGVTDVLELGSGAGHTAAHLREHFTMTLLDVSPQMLDVSRPLNPRCRHVLGDMRSARLGEQFDAVVVHDAVDYMLTEDDLRAVVATAYAHCRPGGMAVFLPGNVRETFATGASTSVRGADGQDGRGARLHSWTWDPDPADTWVLTTYAFVLRHADGRVDTGHETHRTGLFSRDVWLDALAEAGFDGSAVEDDADEPGVARTAFVGHRPRE